LQAESLGIRLGDQAAADLCRRLMVNTDRETNDADQDGLWPKCWHK
jgi:hypothetical protein